LITELPSIPESAVLSLGGFTGYKAAEWNRYFWDSVRRFHPWYFLRHRLGRDNTAWKENDCVYDALKHYLLREFGIFLPEKTLFQVYNRSGKGILPRDLLTAISAVVEPLGLEIERVVVANDTLRAALGYSDRVTDLSASATMDGKPGICMINIHDGYSHAFYWNLMRARKFEEDAFRMALCLRWKTAHPVAFSYQAGLTGYRQMLADFFQGQVQIPGPAAALILRRLETLQAQCDAINPSAPAALETLAADLTPILDAVRAILPRKAHPRAVDLLEAGGMLLAIFRLPTQAA
jgi:hypothetical protein